MLVYGTRPEAVKMAPVVAALRASSAFRPVVAVTGQHREMLDQVNRLFGIEPDHDLDILTPGQALSDVTTKALSGVNALVREVRPDAVVVQGDTTTTFAGALGAFYEQVPVAHVEAGLRTADRYSPFPEEINRRLTTQLTSLHLAPSSQNRKNLLAEGVDPGGIVVTGNTVIDALLSVVERRPEYRDPQLAELAASGRRIIVVTTHRRESWGPRMQEAMGALARVLRAHPDDQIVLPMHRNPVVRDVIRAELGSLSNVTLTEPLDYPEFARLLGDCHLVVTDSGGLQEEAPSLGKPVLVLRDNTERPEAVAAGTVRLVGTDAATIERELTRLLDDEAEYTRMATAVNPFGDGKAASRCVAALAEFFGEGIRLPDWA